MAKPGRRTGLPEVEIIGSCGHRWTTTASGGSTTRCKVPECRRNQRVPIDRPRTAKEMERQQGAAEGAVSSPGTWPGSLPADPGALGPHEGSLCPQCSDGKVRWTVDRTGLLCPSCGHWAPPPASVEAARQAEEEAAREDRSEGGELVPALSDADVIRAEVEWEMTRERAARRFEALIRPLLDIPERYDSPENRDRASEMVVALRRLTTFCQDAENPARLQAVMEAGEKYRASAERWGELFAAALQEEEAEDEEDEEEDYEDAEVEEDDYEPGDFVPITIPKNLPAVSGGPQCGICIKNGRYGIWAVRRIAVSNQDGQVIHADLCASCLEALRRNVPNVVEMHSYRHDASAIPPIPSEQPRGGSFVVPERITHDLQPIPGRWCDYCGFAGIRTRGGTFPQAVASLEVWEEQRFHGQFWACAQHYQQYGTNTLPGWTVKTIERGLTKAQMFVLQRAIKAQETAAAAKARPADSTRRFFTR